MAVQHKALGITYRHCERSEAILSFKARLHSVVRNDEVCACWGGRFDAKNLQKYQ